MALRSRIAAVWMLFIVALTPVLRAQTGWQAAERDAIRTVLERQAADWNRGDIEAFATGYKNSPDILFMGSKISHGYEEMVKNYKAHYSSRAKMGTLHFSELDIQPLDERFATVTGKYHLDLAAEEGGDQDGFYLLVMEKTAQGWKIVRDDTTTLPKTK